MMATQAQGQQAGADPAAARYQWLNRLVNPAFSEYTTLHRRTLPAAEDVKACESHLDLGIFRVNT